MVSISSRMICSIRRSTRQPSGGHVADARGARRMPTGADRQPVAGHLGVGRVVAQGAHEQRGQCEGSWDAGCGGLTGRESGLPPVDVVRRPAGAALRTWPWWTVPSRQADPLVGPAGGLVPVVDIGRRPARYRASYGLDPRSHAGGVAEPSPRQSAGADAPAPARRRATCTRPPPWTSRPSSNRARTSRGWWALPDAEHGEGRLPTGLGRDADLLGGASPRMRDRRPRGVLDHRRARTSGSGSTAASRRSAGTAGRDGSRAGGASGGWPPARRLPTGCSGPTIVVADAAHGARSAKAPTSSACARRALRVGSDSGEAAVSSPSVKRLCYSRPAAQLGVGGYGRGSRAAPRWPPGSRSASSRNADRSSRPAFALLPTRERAPAWSAAPAPVGRHWYRTTTKVHWWLRTSSPKVVPWPRPHSGTSPSPVRREARPRAGSAALTVLGILVGLALPWPLTGGRPPSARSPLGSAPRAVRHTPARAGRPGEACSSPPPRGCSGDGHATTVGEAGRGRIGGPAARRTAMARALRPRSPVARGRQARRAGLAHLVRTHLARRGRAHRHHETLVPGCSLLVAVLAGAHSWSTRWWRWSDWRSSRCWAWSPCASAARWSRIRRGSRAASGVLGSTSTDLVSTSRPSGRSDAGRRARRFGADNDAVVAAEQARSAPGTLAAVRYDYRWST